MDPISSNSERPILLVSLTHLVNDAKKEPASVKDAKYALSPYDIICDNPIFLHYLSSILLLIIQYLLALRQLGTLQYTLQDSKPCIYTQLI